MERLGLNEIREKYLSFFESKEHLRLDSFSLIPQGDKSLLLINSGMAPMKKYFTGEVTPPKKRVTTCQKCIRTPDIENVGKTARHGTFFEMLGNFSFGDYFKNEAIAWAWEFFTKTLEIPEDKLWITVYEQDDEAFDIWTNKVGVSADRVVRMPKSENFWEHGSGPCGPCSEIHFDRGEKYGCGSADCGVGCDCDRFTEVWNLVFTQFENDGEGNYTKLSHPNIDTGMGLERLACILQDADNIFEVDTMQKIMSHISDIAGVKYHTDEKKDISLRVITDHIRSTTFMIGDGVMPSNEGRGYVLRRLLRRAARHGRLLGIEQTFLSEIAKTVIEANRNAYPNLAEKTDFIVKVILNEEEGFGRTIDTGLQLLSEIIEKSEQKLISGEDAFKLYDTFGFPVDLTKEIAAEKGISVDEEKFAELMLCQRKRARDARKDAGADAWKGTGDVVKELSATEFIGYEELCGEAKVIALVSGGELRDSAAADEQAILVLDRTPFYAEGGGQTGDTGVIEGDGFTFEVYNTTKTGAGVFLHQGTVTDGSVKVNADAYARVDEEARLSIMRNHTAAHLLQAALRRVLGSHVEQAGQLVNAAEVRFDFSHFSALTAEELQKIENEVNAQILKSVSVTMTEMPIDEAKKLGAMALFGEKYGDVVRVVEAKGYSIELCGGTHIDNTARLGLFKIVSEGSVASGVRRIQAVTGRGVLDYIDNKASLINECAAAVKVGNIEDLPRRINQISSELKAAEKEKAELSGRLAAIEAERLLSQAESIKGVRLVKASLKNTSPESMRSMCDEIKAGGEATVIVIASLNEEKGNLSFAAACSKAAVEKGAHAGNIVREVAKLAGGSGGGKPDVAMAGGKDISKLKAALDGASDILSSMIIL